MGNFPSTLFGQGPRKAGDIREQCDYQPIMGTLIHMFLASWKRHLKGFFHET